MSDGRGTPAADDLNWHIKKLLDSFYNMKQLGNYPDSISERRALSTAIRQAVKHDRAVHGCTHTMNHPNQTN